MKIESTYPNHSIKLISTLLHKTLKGITIVMLLLSALTCGIINIIMGGKAWSLCVIGAVILFWIVFLHLPIIENTLIRKITVSSIGFCLYMILFNIIYHYNWIILAIPFIYFTVLIINSLIFFADFKKQKRNVLPIFFMLLVSLTFFVASIIGVLTTSIQMIILFGSAIIIIVSGFILIKDKLKLELKKKFHT